MNYLKTLLLYFLIGTMNGALQAQNDPAYWKWAPTPPMGWNSYDALGTSVTEDEALANAAYMKEHLLSHGWQYIVLDARWYDEKSPFNDRDLIKDRTGAKLSADAFGRMMPALNRFPSAAEGKGFKPLADRLHAMGLKFGFHMMRGIPRQSVEAKTPIEGSKFTGGDAGDTTNRCSWCPDMFGVFNNDVGQAWYDSCARLWASWGVDFIKVDDIASHPDEIEMIRKALDKCGRPIVFSTSAGLSDVGKADLIENNANMWRISGDFWDRWEDLDRAFDLLGKWQGCGGLGHFPDMDMIPFGHIGIKCTIAGPDRLTRFTKDEQMTLMSLWALAPSPLMLGNNLPDTDEWTLSLLTNDGLLAIDQDPLARQARRVNQHLGTEVWIRDLKDGHKAVGFFNRTGKETAITLNWNDVLPPGKYSAYDIWQKKDIGALEGTFTQTVPSHGVVLLNIKPL